MFKRFLKEMGYAEWFLVGMMLLGGLGLGALVYHDPFWESGGWTGTERATTDTTMEPVLYTVCQVGSVMLENVAVVRAPDGVGWFLKQTPGSEKTCAAGCFAETLTLCMR